MSYILEALRKSNAEREQGAVPDLHAQPLTLAGGDEDTPAGQATLWLGLAAGVVIVLAAVLGWRFTARDTPPLLAAAPAAAPAPAAVPAAVPAPAPLAVQPAAPPPVVATSPAPAAAPVPAPAPEAPAASATAPASMATAAAPQEPAKKPAPRQRAKPQAPAAPAVAKKPAAVEPPARIASLAELPDDLRRQVPAMAIGGSVYSPQRDRRMLIVNGQILREGDAVAPELHLEQVGAKAAVFSIRGQRFEVPL